MLPIGRRPLLSSLAAGATLTTLLPARQGMAAMRTLNIAPPKPVPPLTFTDADGNPVPRYFQSRPSAAGDGYDASASSGSNLGPLNADLAERIKTDAEAIRADTGATVIPADAVTTSASGLDPHISPAYARLQAARVAQARGVDVGVVQQVIDANTEGALLGFIGQPRVNVLLTNRALDARFPAAT